MSHLSPQDRVHVLGTPSGHALRFLDNPVPPSEEDLILMSGKFNQEIDVLDSFTPDFRIKHLMGIRKKLHEVEDMYLSDFNALSLIIESFVQGYNVHARSDGAVQDKYLSSLRELKLWILRKDQESDIHSVKLTRSADLFLKSLIHLRFMTYTKIVELCKKNRSRMVHFSPSKIIMAIDAALADGWNGYK
mgnify:FL=1